MNVIEKLFHLPEKFNKAFNEFIDLADVMVDNAEGMVIDLILEERFNLIKKLNSRFESFNDLKDCQTFFDSLSKIEIKFYEKIYEVSIEYYNFKKEELK